MKEGEDRRGTEREREREGERDEGEKWRQNVQLCDGKNNVSHTSSVWDLGPGLFSMRAARVCFMLARDSRYRL